MKQLKYGLLIKSAFKIYSDLGLILFPISQKATDEYNYNIINKVDLIDYNIKSGLTNRGYVLSEYPILNTPVLPNNLMLTISSKDIQLIDIIDKSGAGIYIIAELKRHGLAALTTLDEVHPLEPAGSELRGVINQLMGAVN